MGIDALIKSSNPEMEDFIKIAQSSNPYIQTEYGLTRVFVQLLKNDKGRQSLWIEYINDGGHLSQDRVTAMFLKSIIE